MPITASQFPPSSPSLSIPSLPSAAQPPKPTLYTQHLPAFYPPTALSLHQSHPPSPLAQSTTNPLERVLVGGEEMGALQGREEDKTGSSHPYPHQQHLQAGPSTSRSPDAKPPTPPSSATPSPSTTTTSARRRRSTTSSGPRAGGGGRQKSPSPRKSLDRPRSAGVGVSSGAQEIPALPSGAQAPNPHHPFPGPPSRAPSPLPPPVLPPMPIFLPAGPPPGPSPIVQPEGEVCLECLMRDREMADVDVTGPGVWARASDVWYEELVRREAEEDQGFGVGSEESAGGSGEGAGAGQVRRRVRARGSQDLSEGNLKVWLKMNPKEPQSRWLALQSYVRSQKALLDAERSARLSALRESRLLDARVRDAYASVLRDDGASIVTSPVGWSPGSPNGWGVGVKVRLTGGKENGGGLGFWGIPRKKRREDVDETEREKEVTLLQNGLVVEHLDLRREEREREKAEQRTSRRVASRISLGGLGLGRPTGDGTEGRRVASYATAPPAVVGGAELGAYAVTPWRASASASQPTLHHPSQPITGQHHPYGQPFPPTTTSRGTGAAQSPSASYKRLSSPLSSPAPHRRGDSPRSSGEVVPGQGLGIGGLGRMWAAQQGGRWGANGSEWSLAGGEGSVGVRGSGTGSMVDMHLGLDMEKHQMQMAEAARLRASPEPYSPLTLSPRGTGFPHLPPPLPPAQPADTASLAPTSTTAKSRKKGLGSLWAKLRSGSKPSTPTSEYPPEKPARQETEDDLPPLAPPPPLSYLVNRRSADLRSPSLSRPASSISSPGSCGSPSPRSMSFSGGMGGVGTPPTSVSLSLSMSLGQGGGSRIPSPTRDHSVRRVSLDLPRPGAEQLSVVEGSPNTEQPQQLMEGNTPSPSNTVVHNQVSSTANPNATANGNPRSLSIYKSLPALPDRPAPIATESDPAVLVPPHAPFEMEEVQHARRSSFNGTATGAPNGHTNGWHASGLYAAPIPPQQQQQQRGVWAADEEFAPTSRRSVFQQQLQPQPPPPAQPVEETGGKRKSKPKFNFAAFLRRKSFVRPVDGHGVDDGADYSDYPGGEEPFDPPRLPFMPGGGGGGPGRYASDMSMSQSSLSSSQYHMNQQPNGNGTANRPGSIVGSTHRASVLSQKIPQSDDFVAYRYPSLEQPAVEILRR